MTFRSRGVYPREVDLRGGNVAVGVFGWGGFTSDITWFGPTATGVVTGLLV